MPITLDIVGLHPTTILSLEALQWLQERHNFSNILDVGCGNGILSLTSASLWKAHVLAIDIAPQAVRDTKSNISRQRMETCVTTLRSDGFQDTMVHARAPYELIIINLLAEPIAHMVSDVRTHIAGNGICLLSGILEWMGVDVETIYQKHGFTLIHEIKNSPWKTCIMQYGTAELRTSHLPQVHV